MKILFSLGRIQESIRRNDLLAEGFPNFQLIQASSGIPVVLANE